MGIAKLKAKLLNSEKEYREDEDVIFLHLKSSFQISAHSINPSVQFCKLEIQKSQANVKSGRLQRQI